ncbi:MAG: type I-C CRISPR-associated protein Cas7/Csd2 [Acidobacteriia bacterium]|nr:type I-C CRISPR-associated protein Cas7/Csd2 [Terriglobia bacterium]
MKKPDTPKHAYLDTLDQLGARTVNGRQEFVFFFDALDCNPNGDPDAGNLPRIDPETQHGLVTDVCIKRKIRNTIQMWADNQSPYRIFIQNTEALNSLIAKAEPRAKKEADPKTGKEKEIERNREEREHAKKWMMDNFYDIRSFGAVMSTGANAGQVRGPIQIGFSRSIDPIFQVDCSITRIAITTQEDFERKQTEMGRKALVNYGLYRLHGFYNPFLASQDLNKTSGTGFKAADLAVLYRALANMFEFDHSASRGEMHAQALFVFEHTDSLGNAPSHQLFQLIPKPNRVDNNVIPRNVTDYCFASLPKNGEYVAGFPKVIFHTLLNNIPVNAEEVDNV